MCTFSTGKFTNISKLDIKTDILPHTNTTHSTRVEQFLDIISLEEKIHKTFNS